MRKLVRMLLACLLLALAWVQLVYVPQAALHGPRAAIDTSPAEVGLEYFDVALSPADADLHLAGWWMPAPEARATLVFIHGGGSNRHSRYFRALRFYRAMVEQGVSVLTIDLRNHGDSGSDGRGLQFGATESADASAAIAWARQRAPQLPVYAMGISMGGATLVHAVADGAAPDGLILLDPLLDTRSAFTAGAWTATGLPPSLFAPAAWSAVTFFGLPDGAAGALARASELQLPILLLQDPLDPVTRVEYAVELAQANPQVRLWLAPAPTEPVPKLAWKGRWGSHVAAFELYPDQTLRQILDFVGLGAL